nr:cysteine-rich and transmembrane domain-containing protein WIH1-like [Ipomoea batatas]
MSSRFLGIIFDALNLSIYPPFSTYIYTSTSLTLVYSILNLVIDHRSTQTKTMSSNNNHQFDHDYAKGPEMAAPPPPAGYPTVAGDAQVRRGKRHKTKSRGDGFWKGCCAALCCCWVLDVCC